MSATVVATAPASRAFPPETPWAEIEVRAPQMASTMFAYLDQLAVSHRSTSVDAASLTLRHLAAYLTATDPNCRRVADITRAHIEGYKVALAARPGRKGALSSTTIRHNPGHAQNVLRADHRLGLARRSSPRADLRG